MMWLFNYFLDELPKNLFTIFLSAIGFLLALSVNGLLARLREINTVKSMLSAVHAEATSNETVLWSYTKEKLLSQGMVLKEFRIVTAQALLANPLFMKY